jgi:cellulose synthase (UDP-forming)
MTETRWQSGVRSLVAWLLPQDQEGRDLLKSRLIRILIATNLLLGFHYLSWRYMYSINWATWPIALALIMAETYSFIDSILFGLTMWRLRRRPSPPLPTSDMTADVYITCYNEPIDLVRETAVAARDIRWPHKTYILDDGNSPAMRAMAEEVGIGYIVRTKDWQGRDRHAKAGNVNNALFQTTGEFILILDADQIPYPEILHQTLGYFHDPAVAFVQTPQWFYNVPPGDPFGVEAPLFYGPIQQGKDGWNSAFFCGSNAVLRREALMQVGVSQYVRELEARVRLALRTADRVLRSAEVQFQVDLDYSPEEQERTGAALRQLRDGVREAQAALRAGEPIQDVTWNFQRKAEAVGRVLVNADLQRIQAELADIPGVDPASLHDALEGTAGVSTVVETLTSREASPLAAISVVRDLLLTVDVDREDEAIPVMPLARISVTEDMATAMRLHSLGWKSVYHHEVLARGLAPDDLRSALQQRLRWAQGTIQVMFRENPLLVRGLRWPQKLMYFATMWSYLSGFFAIVYLAAPVLYLVFGILPVRALSAEFFWHLIPYLLVNQLLFLVIGWGLPTWRGQQYSLALFPLWIKAVTSAIGNVFFGRKLGFVVTPKTRQGGVHLSLVRPQLIAMGILCFAIVWGLARLALGFTDQAIPILVNVFWACYDLVALSAVLDAATYQPAPEESDTIPPGDSVADLVGRVGAGHA